MFVCLCVYADIQLALAGQTCACIYVCMYIWICRLDVCMYVCMYGYAGQTCACICGVNMYAEILLCIYEEVGMACVCLCVCVCVCV